MKEDKASMTALFVAWTLLMLGGDEYGRSRLPPNSFETIWKFLVGGKLVSYLWACILCNPIFPKIMRIVRNAIGHPPYMERLGYRKVYMEFETRKALDRRDISTKQVLVIAVGYETLGYRLSTQYPDVQFWEIDHPNTAKERMKGINALGGMPSTEHLLLADLTKCSLEDVLTKQDGYDVKAPTVVIIEGLTYYLTEEHVKQLFIQVSKVTGKGSVLLFDFFKWNDEMNCPEIVPGKPEASKRFAKSVEKRGEPFYWAINPTKLNDFVKQSGNWELTTPISNLNMEFLQMARLISK